MTPPILRKYVLAIASFMAPIHAPMLKKLSPLAPIHSFTEQK